MNENLKALIRAVAENNNQKAKQYIKIIIDNDTTQANKAFCNNIKNMLQASSKNLIELPHDIQGILYMEDISISFNENRYFLSEREQYIADEVLGVYQTSQKLSEMGISYLNSLMLHGESGTGKTLFGKYLAYKLGLPFVYMNFSNAISSYLGSTGKNISKAFKFLEKQKCVFMIDEVDAIGLKRGHEDVGEMSRVVIGLMQAIDYVKNDTVIIGATNRLDILDKALLRRFALVNEVKKFTKDEAFKMIDKFLRDIDVVYNDNDIMKYCETENSQAIIMNDVIRAVAKMIRFDTGFQLTD